jgi:hypothetical protein
VGDRNLAEACTRSRETHGGGTRLDGRPSAGVAERASGWDAGGGSACLEGSLMAGARLEGRTAAGGRRLGEHICPGRGMGKISRGGQFVGSFFSNPDMSELSYFGCATKRPFCRSCDA